MGPVLGALKNGFFGGGGGRGDENIVNNVWLS